jgi:hypothetical protein
VREREREKDSFSLYWNAIPSTGITTVAHFLHSQLISSCTTAPKCIQLKYIVLSINLYPQRRRNSRRRKCKSDSDPNNYKVLLHSAAYFRSTTKQSASSFITKGTVTHTRRTLVPRNYFISLITMINRLNPIPSLPS